MSQKNETLILFLASVIPICLIFSGLWIFRDIWQTNSNNNNANITDNKVLASRCEITVEGTFNYGGSTTWAPIRKDVDSVLQQNCPKFNLRYVQPPTGNPGSGTGIKMLIDNQLTFSQSSRSVKAEENAQAQAKGFSLQEIPAAIDAIVVAVNPKLNIPGLTVNQIQGIYTGKITNWQAVGGPNLPITPITRPKEAGGTVEFFVENILEKASFGENISYIGTTTEALRKVARIDGAIYYASAPEVVPQCTVKTLPIGRNSQNFIVPYKEPYIPLSQCPNQRNQLNTVVFRNGDYPITRNLFVIVKKNGQIDEQAGTAYANWILTNQGQQLIEKAGFIRLK
ncbi:PstS family phosphate ABC transporter substrate-binding protein [Anabaena azotica]|uniref:PstS family phosphate ABC transporter substrate-binding protein n=1 Tax=Anabaena azotica FACHB-119 TaxID=947527 RepID=A0ABR8CVW7_9NOST|nr:PstS family phosphate ABC transporter substrate-binding protein [Anabaena azotica]MBD2499075.1 PstS family phosphate ABC transporter substrate-binding protein [Anabaena azotica FACHB-119]